MREIKFRGYAVEEIVGDQWLYGTGVRRRAKQTGVKEEWFIYTDSGWERVRPGSIGQYTGLTDRNDTEIYEGDILKVPDLYETPENTYTAYHHEKVIYENHGFGTDNAMFYEDGDYISEECEVIGNIYEHPKLLQP